MNIKKYLERLHYKGNLLPDLTTLKGLHQSHLYTIPFENLDIHINRKIRLESSALQRKIIDSGRGGYCYELNGMFYLLLKKLGFIARIISARVSNGTGGWGEEYDHLAIMVSLKDLWLTDVGFGDSFISPLKIELNSIQPDDNGFYKIIMHDDKYMKLMKSETGNEFADEYIFMLTERNWNEFNAMNDYHQTSPESHFTKSKICSIATKNGRISLSDNKLIITENKNKKIIGIKDDKGFTEKLSEYFSIQL